MRAFVFPSAVFGGHEVMTLKIIRELLADNQSLYCIVNESNEKLIAELARLNVNFELCRFSDTKWDMVFGNSSLKVRRGVNFFARKLRELHLTHIVIINGNAVANHSTTLALANVCKKCRVRVTMYIPMLHSSKELGLSRTKAIVYKAALRRSMAAVTDVITISQTWRARARNFKANEDLFVIQNLVQAAAKTDYMSVETHNHLTIGFIGRLEKFHKGLDFLFDIIERVASTRKVILHVVGDGPDRTYAESRANRIRATSRSEVRLHGWLSDVRPVLATSDLLLMPSRVEGAPLVALEAAYTNIPVFAFDVPGVADVVESRYLFPAFDINAIAEALQEVEIAELKAYGASVSKVSTFFDQSRFKSEVLVALSAC